MAGFRIPSGLQGFLGKGNRVEKEGGLRRGMTGAAVSALQQRLVASNFMTLNDAKSGPGVYGPRTEAAVRLLQAQVGLPVTGIAEAKTLEALARGVRRDEDLEDSEVTVRGPLVASADSGFDDDDEATQTAGRPVTSKK